jgi:hypothetical protein
MIPRLLRRLAHRLMDSEWIQSLREREIEATVSAELRERRLYQPNNVIESAYLRARMESQKEAYNAR